MHAKTISGVAPPSFRSAPGADVVSGIYRFRLTPSPVDDKPARELSLTDIRGGLQAAINDALRAKRDGRDCDETKYLRDAELLCRALQRFEAHEERARLAKGRE